jgi:hypothetical protein
MAAVPQTIAAQARTWAHGPVIWAFGAHGCTARAAQYVTKPPRRGATAMSHLEYYANAVMSDRLREAEQARRRAAARRLRPWARRRSRLGVRPRLRIA